MKKRITYIRRSGTAALLCFILFVPLLAGRPVQASEGSLNGNGSSGTPYIIEDAEDLRKFSDLVNGGDSDAHGILSADIMITGAWEPIGNAESSYTGIFSGSGHTVTFSAENAAEYQGLFGHNKGMIQNVTISGILSGTGYTGGIAAVNHGSISGCRNQADISSLSAVSFAGGIAGVNTGTIVNSENAGSVSSPESGASLGGIAGAAREGTIKNCTNKGGITLAPEQSDDDYSEGCAGGITGLNYKAAIEQSGNYGSVTNSDANGYAGGITGLNNGSVADCVNGETIRGNYYAGGIAGYNFLNTDAGNASIHNTLNHGTVAENQTGYGAVCGVNHGGTVYDSFYLEGSAAAGIGTADNNGTTVKTPSALANGETAYQLNGNQSSSPVWYQTLGADSYPVLDSTHGIVYRKSADGSVSYSNNPQDHTDHEFGEDGTCNICHYESVSLYGHSLTLDGAIGINCYYYIDPVYYNDGSCTIRTSFKINGRTETDTFDPSSVLSTGNTDTPQVYGFQLYINSDEMTSDIRTTMEIIKDGKTIVTLTEGQSFRGYDYLTQLYENKDQHYSEELQTLARALATHDYYANEYFRYRPSYKPEIPLLPLESVTEETVQPYTQIIEDQNGYPAAHYALSMQFLSEHILYLYITSEKPLEETNLYLGYRNHGSADDYTYVSAEKYGKYYRGITGKIPASELDTMLDCAFFLKQADGSYQQITSVKTAGPLSYVFSALRPGTNDSVRKLTQALYLYHTASRAYFDSV